MQSACAVLLTVACFFFQIISYTERFSKKKIVIEYKTCVSIFLHLCKTSPILRRIQRHMIENELRSSCKVAVILVTVLGKLNFLNISSTKYSNIKHLEHPYSGSQDFHAGKRTDIQRDGQAGRNDKADSRFS